MDAHIPVLAQEALEALAVQADGLYVDATFGRGGHTARILEALGSRRARARARPRSGGHRGRPRAVLPTKCGLRSSTRRLPISPRSCRQLARGRPVRGILFDLGVSSPQLDDPARGFSFRADGPLDMRMDPTTRRTGFRMARARGRRRDSRGDRDARRRALRAADRRRRSWRRAREQPAHAHARSSPSSWRAPCARASPASIRRRARSRRCACSSTTSSASSNAALAGRARACSRSAGGSPSSASIRSKTASSSSSCSAHSTRRSGARAACPSIPEPREPRLTRIGRKTRAGDEELARNPRARSAVLRVAEKVR